MVIEIGLKDIYDLLVATNTQLIELRAEVRDLVKQTEDHEARIRALERGRWPLPALSVVIALAALLFPFLNQGKS